MSEIMNELMRAYHRGDVAYQDLPRNLQFYLSPEAETNWDIYKSYENMMGRQYPAQGKNITNLNDYDYNGEKFYQDIENKTLAGPNKIGTQSNGVKDRQDAQIAQQGAKMQAEADAAMENWTSPSDSFNRENWKTIHKNGISPEENAILRQAEADAAAEEWMSSGDPFTRAKRAAALADEGSSGYSHYVDDTSANKNKIIVGDAPKGKSVSTKGIYDHSGRANVHDQIDAGLWTPVETGNNSYGYRNFLKDYHNYKDNAIYGNGRPNISYAGELRGKDPNGYWQNYANKTANSRNNWNSPKNVNVDNIEEYLSTPMNNRDVYNFSKNHDIQPELRYKRPYYASMKDYDNGNIISTDTPSNGPAETPVEEIKNIPSTKQPIKKTKSGAGDLRAPSEAELKNITSGKPIDVNEVIKANTQEYQPQTGKTLTKKIFDEHNINRQYKGRPENYKDAIITKLDGEYTNPKLEFFDRTKQIIPPKVEMRPEGANKYFDSAKQKMMTAGMFNWAAPAVAAKQFLGTPEGNKMAMGLVGLSASAAVSRLMDLGMAYDVAMGIAEEMGGMGLLEFSDEAYQQQRMSQPE